MALLYRGYNFNVKFEPMRIYNKDVADIIRGIYGFSPDKYLEIAFKSISGLEITTEVLEYKEGGRNTNILKFPGQKSYSPVVMERGFSNNRFLYQWFKSLEDNNLDVRYIVNISLYDRVHKNPGRIFRLRNAWISDYRISNLDATASEILIESITLQYEILDIIPAFLENVDILPTEKLEQFA